MTQTKKSQCEAIGLTKLEKETLWKVADRVNDNMSYQKDEGDLTGEYRENSEDFILSLDVIEKQALENALKKLF